MKDQNVISKEVYAHKNGLKYAITWEYDNDSGSPIEMGDCGVVDKMMWNPTDEGKLEEYLDQYDVGLEEESRLRLMRVLRAPSYRSQSGIYYDYLASLNRAHTEWGIQDHDDVVRIVEADFEWLKGWYNDDWHWIAVSAAPIDPDTDVVLNEHRQHIGGYESSILESHRDVWREEAIREIISEIEWTRRNVAHPGQMELSFA